MNSEVLGEEALTQMSINVWSNIVISHGQLKEPHGSLCMVVYFLYTLVSFIIPCWELIEGFRIMITRSAFIVKYDISLVTILIGSKVMSWKLTTCFTKILSFHSLNTELILQAIPKQASERKCSQTSFKGTLVYS